MSLKGIDVSHYNQPINWNQVKGQIDFAILKMGNIGDNKKFWLDASFKTNYNACKSLGIPIGVYLYSYTNQANNAKLAGQEVANYIKDLHFELPVYIDMEDNEIKVEGKAKLSELVRAFNAEIEKSGKWAGVYANLDWFRNYLDESIKTKYTTWIAHVEFPNQLDKYKGQYDMFQYSWKGHVAGINGNNGNVDMNIMYRDLITEINGGKEITPQKPQEGSDEPVRVYQNGSTPEKIYADTDLIKHIGTLNPYESCDCFGEFHGRAMVRYHVDGSDNYKIGFAKWLGGIK